MKLKNIKPNSFGDYLAIISFIGFLVIFLNSISSINLNPYLTSIFLIFSGAGLMTAGKIFSINQWISDGLQGSEFAWLFTSIFGILSVVIGILALPQINLITPQLQGIISISALASMVFIVYQYLIND